MLVRNILGLKIDANSALFTCYSIEGENQGQKIAAATYLKNFTRRNIDGSNGGQGSKVSKEFKDQLLRALLLAEPAVLKVLIEAVQNLVVFSLVTAIV